LLDWIDFLTKKSSDRFDRFGCNPSPFSFSNTVAKKRLAYIGVETFFKELGGVPCHELGPNSMETRGYMQDNLNTVTAGAFDTSLNTSHKNLKIGIVFPRAVLKDLPPSSQGPCEPESGLWKRR